MDGKVCFMQEFDAGAPVGSMSSELSPPPSDEVTMLEYQNEVFLDLVNEDGLVVMAKGLGLDDIVLSLFKVYCDPGNLVLVIGTYNKEEEYFLERLKSDGVEHLPKVVTAKYTANDRKKLYMDGGVLFITSRILVVDLLTRRVPIEHVTGFVVLKAHRVLDFCQEAFILRLYREKNKTGFVKAFTVNAVAFTRGFCQVERVMRNLFVRRLHLWPRFHATVGAALERQRPETIEVRLSLTPAMLAIQTALLDLITISVRDLKRCNPSLDLEEVNTENAIGKALDKVVRHQLDSIWNQLSRKTKQLVNDLKQLRSILFYLTQYDSVTFFNTVENLKISKEVNNSGWMFLPSAQTLFVQARERLHSGDLNRAKKLKRMGNAISGDQPAFPNSASELSFEENPKWSAVHEILNEIKESMDAAKFPSEASNTLIVTADERTSEQVREFLCYGSKKLLKRLYKKVILRNNFQEALTMDGKNSKARDDKDHQSKDLNPRLLTLTQLIAPKNGEDDLLDSEEQKPVSENHKAQVVAVQSLKNDGGAFDILRMLETMKPRYVIVYDVDITFVRQLEVYQAVHSKIPVIVYLLFYDGSAEEQLYLNVLRREKEAFEMLIRQKANMVIPEDQDGRGEGNSIFDRDTRKASETVNNQNTRSGGRTTDAQSPKEKPKVIVDMREFRSELPCLIYARGIDVEPVTLEVGDYILTPEICVERKSIDDLIGSLNNGRLYSQATAMCRYYKRPMLLIEFDLEKPFALQGKYEYSKEISAHDFQSKLLILTIHFPKLRILWCSSPYATAEIFKEIKAGKEQPSAVQAAAVTEAFSAEMGIETNVDKYNSAPKDFMILMPGVDSKNCRMLLNKTGSLAEMAKNWTLPQLEELLGNSDTAKTLWESVHTCLKSPSVKTTDQQTGKSGSGNYKGFKGPTYKNTWQHKAAEQKRKRP